MLSWGCPVSKIAGARAFQVHDRINALFWRRWVNLSYPVNLCPPNKQKNNNNKTYIPKDHIHIDKSLNKNYKQAKHDGQKSRVRHYKLKIQPTALMDLTHFEIRTHAFVRRSNSLNTGAKNTQTYVNFVSKCLRNICFERLSLL